MNIVKILTVIFVSVVNITYAEELKSQPEIPAKTVEKTITIETKVTGSQEQPKVLYIMPWQGVANPITIKDQKTQLSMPEFKPINPKAFKKEVRDFVVKQMNKVPIKATKNN